MAKTNKQRDLGPPSNGIPPKWEVKGVTYEAVATDSETDIVTVKSSLGNTHFFNFNKLRDRLNSIGIKS